MPPPNPDTPLVVECELCGDRIVSRRVRALYDAADHALDFHRVGLLAKPEEFDRYFRFRNPATGRPARIIKR